MEELQSLSMFKATLMKWALVGFEYLPNLVASALAIWIGYLLSPMITRASQRFSNRFFKGQKGVANIINGFVLGFFWFVVVMFVLDVLQLTSFITHILAGAGIIGVIVGFALKDVASNACAGMLIRAQRPFKVGDWVCINGYTGTIYNQGLIMTGIQTVGGQMAYVPNQMIYNGSYINYSTFGKFRVILQIGVSYGDDLAHVEAVALKTVRALPMVIEPEKADFYFTNIGASTYNFKVRYWIKYTERKDFLEATNRGIQALKKAFEDEDICVAYNVMTLDFGGKGGVNLMDKPVKVENVAPIIITDSRSETPNQPPN